MSDQANPRFPTSDDIPPQKPGQSGDEASLSRRLSFSAEEALVGQTSASQPPRREAESTSGPQRDYTRQYRRLASYENDRHAPGGILYGVQADVSGFDGAIEERPGNPSHPASPLGSLRRHTSAVGYDRPFALDSCRRVIRVFAKITLNVDCDPIEYVPPEIKRANARSPISWTEPSRVRNPFWLSITKRRCSHGHDQLDKG